MVQNTTEGTTRRGRPPKFRRDDVVAAAIEVFWRHGIDHVTLDDLEAATGVDRSTLYNSFDGKAGLYRSAAEQYVDRTIERIFAPLTLVDDGIEATAQMLERLREANITADLPSGCLIVNDLGSPSVEAASAHRYLESLRGGVASALERAVVAGALSEASARSLGDVVTTGVLGANLASRAIGRDAAVTALEALATTVRSASAPTSDDDE